MALRLYQRHGYRLIAQNVFNPNGKRFGEIDLIMRKGSTIIFVEVKTRQKGSLHAAAESVHAAKRRRLVKTMQWYLHANPDFQTLQPRIDVCLVKFNNLDNTEKNVIIIPNAIGADF